MSRHRDRAPSFDDIIYGAPTEIPIGGFVDPATLDYDDGPPREPVTEDEPED